MANENEKSQKNDVNELYAWLAKIPCSKSMKNLTRDISDAVLMADILKFYYPRYVDLHNYTPANNLNAKKENWNLLNRKVLVKIDLKLSKEIIEQLANAQPGIAEQFLLEVKNKILKNPETIQDLVTNTENNNASLEEDCTSKNEQPDLNNVSVVDEAELKNAQYTSTFMRMKQITFYAIRFLLKWLFIWTYLRIIYNFLRSIKYFNKMKTIAAKQNDSYELNEEVSVPRHICTQLKQELREKEDTICTLNHKVAYLESAMKLKDLRISNLTTNILQNAVQNELSAQKNSAGNCTQRKRSRSANNQPTK